MKRTLVALALGAALLSVAGCAARQAGGQLREAALILATDAYELHYRDGRVFLVRPDADAPPPVELRTYKEFRGFYFVEGGREAPPAPAPGQPVEVTGWRDQECVRLGQACGRAPEPLGRGDAVRLQLVFPERN